LGFTIYRPLPLSLLGSTTGVGDKDWVPNISLDLISTSVHSLAVESIKINKGLYLRLIRMLNLYSIA